MNADPGPNFFIIGAAKAATTSLFSLLQLHPQAGMARGKEPHYFTNNYNHPWERYAAHFKHVRGRKAIGDASTSYSRLRIHPLVVDRIRHHVPDAKIIYMVRHPLKRMESAYAEFACTAEGKAYPSINDAVKQEAEIIDSSRYWEVFEAYRQKFDESKIKVVWFEDYVADTIAVFQDVCRFLEINDCVVPNLELERTNSRDEVKVRLARVGRPNVALNTTWDDDVRRWVIDQIREDNCRFLDHFGRPRNFWGEIF